MNLAAYFDKLKLDLSVKEQECKEVQNVINAINIRDQILFILLDNLMSKLINQMN